MKLRVYLWNKNWFFGESEWKVNCKRENIDFKVPELLQDIPKMGLRNLITHHIEKDKQLNRWIERSSLETSFYIAIGDRGFYAPPVSIKWKHKRELEKKKYVICGLSFGISLNSEICIQYYKTFSNYDL